MNTHDIELPPLPEPDFHGPSGTGTYFNGYTSTTLEAYARLAIEANLKRTGEPVAYRLLRKNADGEWVTDGRPWCDGVPDADLVKDSEKSGQYRIEYAFADPQPAETVKVPSDEDLIELAKDCESMPGGMGMFRINYARALLVKYGQPAEPRLDAPAQVGHTRFGEGVPWSTVIGAAQRYHAAQNTPAKEKERLQRAAENIKALHQAEPGKPIRDWVEDATHENGNYQCKCVHCGEVFVGHKRRVTCRTCAEPVKVPSNNDILGLASKYNLEHPTRVLRFARALLTRYGQPTQPAQGQEVSIDISTGDHDAGRRAFGKLTGEVNAGVWLAEGYVNQPTASAEPFGHVWRASDTTAVIKLVGDPRIRDGMPVYAAPVVAQPSAEPPSSD